MATVEGMRSFLLSLYGEQWKQRVKRMRDNQIVATYTRIQNKERERRK